MGAKPPSFSSAFPMVLSVTAHSFASQNRHCSELGIYQDRNMPRKGVVVVKLTKYSPFGD